MKLRKLSAVFLCLVMVFSLLPFYAFAQYETYYFLQISTDGNSWDNYNASETLSIVQGETIYAKVMDNHGNQHNAEKPENSEGGCANIFYNTETTLFEITGNNIGFEEYNFVIYSPDVFLTLSVGVAKGNQSPSNPSAITAEVSVDGEEWNMYEAPDMLYIDEEGKLYLRFKDAQGNVIGANTPTYKSGVKDTVNFWFNSDKNWFEITRRNSTSPGGASEYNVAFYGGDVYIPLCVQAEVRQVFTTNTPDTADSWQEYYCGSGNNGNRISLTKAEDEAQQQAVYLQFMYAGEVKDVPEGTPFVNNNGAFQVGGTAYNMQFYTNGNSSVNVEPDAAKNILKVTPGDTNGEVQLTVFFEHSDGENSGGVGYDVLFSVNGNPDSGESDAPIYQIFITNTPDAADSWQEYNMGTQNNFNYVTIRKSEDEAQQAVTYIKLKVVGEEVDIPAGTPVMNSDDFWVIGDESYNLQYNFYGAGSIKVEPDADANMMKVTSGDSNGEVQLKMITTEAHIGGGESVNGYDILFNVTGNAVAEGSSSPYAEAVIVDATKKEAGNVLVAQNVNGTAGDNANFTVDENGNLYFVKDNQPAGNYDITIGGQLYTAVIFPQVKNADMDGRQMKVSTQQLTVKDLCTYGFHPEIENYTYFSTYITPEDDKVNASVNLNDGFTFLMDENGNAVIQPKYIYKIQFAENEQDNKVVSFDDDEFIEINGGVADWLSFQRVNLRDETVNEDIWAYRIAPKSTSDITLRPTTSFETSFNIVKRSESSVQVVDSFRMRLRYEDTNLGEELGIVRTNDLASLPQGVLVQFDMCMMQGANPSTAMFYLVKENNTGAEFALYDSINLSTLRVYTTDSSKVYPAEFTIQNRSGENAIGIAMQVTGTETPFAEEILVTFEDVNGNKYYAYTEASCYPQYSGESAEVTVGTVDEFLDAYNSIPGGTIYVKGGTYSFDFVHNRNSVKIVGIGDENNPTIFNGAANSTGPVVKLLNNENFSFEGITVDGRSKTRIGVYADQQSSLRFNDITVQNCSIGAICDSVYTGHFIFNNLFKNNTIGFYIKYCYAALEENRFENNGTAIYISKDINDTVYIKNNTFIGSTTADIDNDSTADISVSQNYFGTDENTSSKPKVKEKNGGNYGRVFFSPYYTKVDRSEMDATLDGAQQNADGSYTVPVDTSLGGGYLLGDQLFNEMKNSKDPVLVSVPLSAVNNGKMEVVAIWEFTTENVDSEADRPNGTNLEVTDTPSSEASSLVNEKVENSDEIIQFVNFTHEGDLPGKTLVYVLKKANSNSNNLKLYFVNVDKNTIENAEIQAVTEKMVDGVPYYVITVDHCSEYFIAEDITLKAEKDSGSSSSSNKDKAEATPAPTATPVPTPVPTVKPAATTTPEVAEQPVEMPKEADTTIADATASEKVIEAAKETVTVTEGTAAVYAEAVEKIVEAAEESAPVVLPLTQTTQEVVNKAEIDTAALEKVAEAEREVVIQLTDATVKLDAKALKAVTEQAKGKTIEICVVKTEPTSLTSAQQKKIKDMDTAVVVSAQIFSDGEYIGKFKGGKATVMLPFEIEEGRNADDYKVYYIDEKGDLKKVAAEYVNGYMIFTTAHFSDYVIVYEGEYLGGETEITVIPDTTAEKGSLPIVPIIIVIAIIIVSGTVVLIKKKTAEE